MAAARRSAPDRFGTGSPTVSTSPLGLRRRFGRKRRTQDADRLLSSINVTSSQDERDFYARFVALKPSLTEGDRETKVVTRLQESVVGGEDRQDVLLAILR